jgi:hypothetical protein
VGILSAKFEREGREQEFECELLLVISVEKVIISVVRLAKGGRIPRGRLENHIEHSSNIHPVIKVYVFTL